MSSSTPSVLFVRVPIRDLAPEALEKLSKDKKLSLSREDMVAVQEYFVEKDREPTDVELEVIAQTWSEHCKHRIFGSQIEHTLNGKTETVDGLFKSYIRASAERIMAQKPGFVLSAFVDNAGFIKLDETNAVCLKVETHNHPSAIEPYAGANTGLGGVIRDILGAGLGAKPIANLDVFCFGAPDTPREKLKAKDVIHPLGIMRGVVRGVRDYGNRMGIPTVNGAIQFDDTYIYNPLVFCGTAGVIPSKDIPKEMLANLQIVAVGGRTGRDGLKGATFSSASLTADSHEEDKSAVQIGNPIEEKKVLDFILEAREQGLIVFITDCGAGGFSSAAGEMLSETGGELFLERAPLKEPGLISWEIFLSESQERMVLAATEDNLPKLQALADKYQTEMVVLGHSDGTGILKIWHDGQLVCELDCQRLHEAPRQHRTSTWNTPPVVAIPQAKVADPMALTTSLKLLLQDFAIVSREPVIREYDHQVQGNTLLTPLAGATGDAPQDGSVVRVDGSPHLVAIACSLLPEWGKTAPYEMGAAVTDECFRQLVAVGADPDQIAILDNFCMGNPDDQTELGALVESVKGMCEVAEIYGAPFVSGKDSFYNYFLTDDGPVSIPVTALVSGMGIVEKAEHIIGSSLRKADSVICLLGETTPELGGSVYARVHNLKGQPAPSTDAAANLTRYRAYHAAVKAGLILSTHDVSEGGLAVSAAEMAFSLKGGLELVIPEQLGSDEFLFSESPGRFLIEVSPANLTAAQQALPGLQVLGHATAVHGNLKITGHGKVLVDESILELKGLWKSGLVKFY